MKKFFLSTLVLAVCFLGVNSAKAADATTGTSNSGVTATSDQVTVNINLSSVQSLVVNPSQKEVDINYLTATDYKNGVSVTEADHLTVFSTGGFKVTAKSDGNFKAGDGTSINSSDVTLTAATGTNNTTSSVFTAVPLSTSDQTLISSTSGTNGDLNYNVTYDNTAEKTDLYKTLNTTNATKTYTAKVTYTIVAQ